MCTNYDLKDEYLILFAFQKLTRSFKKIIFQNQIIIYKAIIKKALKRSIFFKKVLLKQFQSYASIIFLCTIYKLITGSAEVLKKNLYRFIYKILYIFKINRRR
jgi:hypothetical protein